LRHCGTSVFTCETRRGIRSSIANEPKKKKEQKAYFITVNASVVLDFNRPHLGRHTGLGLFLLPMIEYTVDKVYLIRSELSDGGSFIWPPSTLHQN